MGNISMYREKPHGTKVLETARSQNYGKLGYKTTCLSRKAAKEILEGHNNYNRKMQPAKVNKYRQAMNSGNWNFHYNEGNTIVFDETLEILSAQHRLEAFVQSEVKEWKVLIAIVNRDFWLENTVESRSAKDKLEMHMKNEDLDPKYTDLMMVYQNQFPTMRTSSPVVTTRSPKETISRGDAFNTVKAAADSVDSLIRVYGVKPTVVVRKALFILMAFGLLRSDDFGKVAQEIPKIADRIKHDNLPGTTAMWTLFLWRVLEGFVGDDVVEIPECITTVPLEY